MITGIILASGFSKRMGQDKLLMDVDGKKMVEGVIIASQESSLDRIILVYRNEEVKEIGDHYSIASVHNPLAHLGQSEGIKVGVKEAGITDAYMFLLGDQPFISSQLIDQLILEYKNSPSSIIVPYYNGRKGNPVVFPSIYKEELLAIEGDTGGRQVIKNNPSSIKKVYIENEKLGMDIDKPSDFTNLL